MSTFDLRSQGIILGRPYSSRIGWKHIGVFNGPNGYFPDWMEYSPELDQYLIGTQNSADIFSSEDNLQTWVVRPHGIAGAQKWRDCAWSPQLSLYAMTCATLGASVIATSPNGLAWTKILGLVDAHFRGIHWSPEIEKFVCVSELSGVFTSVNGVAWLNFAQAGGNTIVDVAYSPSLDRWVAVLATGSTAPATTRVRAVTGNPSVINWPLQTTPTIGGVAPNWNHVIWSPELTLFVASAIGDTTEGCFMTSPNGLAPWTLRQTVPAHSRQGLAYSPTLARFISSSSTSKRKISTSENASAWADRRSARPATAGTTFCFWNRTKSIFVANGARGLASIPTQRIQFSRKGK